MALLTGRECTHKPLPAPCQVACRRRRLRSYESEVYSPKPGSEQLTSLICLIIIRIYLTESGDLVRVQTCCNVDLILVASKRFGAELAQSWILENAVRDLHFHHELFLSGNER